MNYMAKVTFYVDWKDREEIQKKDIMDIYSKLRKTLVEYEATFNAHYIDKINCDEVTLEFPNALALGGFISTEVIWHKIRWYTITADDARKRSFSKTS